MSRLRFATACSLFEAFPELARKATVPPSDEPSLAFLRNLSARGRFDEAVAFCAHLLPRREAVWWACVSTRQFLGDALRARSPALAAAETWVQAPSNDNRAEALRIGQRSDDSDPLTWLALSAGWSGGLLASHPQQTVAVPPYMTARAARIAILLSARHIAVAERPERQRACIADGIRMAEPDDGERGAAAVRQQDQRASQGFGGP